MMASLSETASIITVLQLCSKIVKYIGNVQSASKDRKRLRDEIRACERILQELKDDADDSEGEAWVDTIKALERPDGPLIRLLEVLQVEAKFQTKDSLRKSLRWLSMEKDVLKLIEMIEQEKRLLNLAISNKTGILLI
ncbi:hypothetical protein BKA66DRAFT_613171 [Pyrenochaeta sp. MPI-SDFR-AT-0127]|nr:hypothetical protein BKA66DRAFT_613171 [Pyrenochaeta sp. MPI-SDFR-AT-0127]